MRTPINKEQNQKLSKESSHKLKILSNLIKENAFSHNDKKLWGKLGYRAPTVVQNIKEQNLGKDTTVNRHWENFTKKFAITDDGIYCLFDTLEKYNKLKKTNRKGFTSLELLKVIENPAVEKNTRTMMYLDKCNIYEKIAFVGLAIYDEMMERKDVTRLAFCGKLRKLFNELWPHRDFFISRHFIGLEFIDITIESSKLDSIVQTNFNYLLMKQEYERIRNIPYTNCFNNSFKRVDIDTDSFWVEENTGRIWYVNEHVLQNGIDIYIIAVFDEYSTKCSEVYQFEFFDGNTVGISSLPQTFLGYYDYKLSDNGDSMEFTSDEGFSRHKLPAKLLRVGSESPAVKLLKKGMNEESINEAAQLYVYDVITDVTISRQYLIVITTNGTYFIERYKYPDIKNLHPDDEAFLMISNKKEFVIFRGNYALNIPLEDFEPLTNEMIIKQLGLDE